MCSLLILTYLLTTAAHSATALRGFRVHPPPFGWFQLQQKTKCIQACDQYHDALLLKPHPPPHTMCGDWCRWICTCLSFCVSSALMPRWICQQQAPGRQQICTGYTNAHESVTGRMYFSNKTSLLLGTQLLPSTLGGWLRQLQPGRIACDNPTPGLHAMCQIALDDQQPL
jgi:hypothetical protein